jgi:hypothetical protein
LIRKLSPTANTLLPATLAHKKTLAGPQSFCLLLVLYKFKVNGELDYAFVSLDHSSQRIKFKVMADPKSSNTKFGQAAIHAKYSP